MAKFKDLGGGQGCWTVASQNKQGPEAAQILGL